MREVNAAAAGGGRRSARRGAAAALSNSAASFAPDLRKRVLTWKDFVEREADEHPGRSVAAAVGLGFLLGGGLFSSLSGRILAAGVRVGLRVALVPFVTKTMVALGQELMSTDRRASGSATSAEPPSVTRNETPHAKQKETHS